MVPSLKLKFMIFRGLSEVCHDLSLDTLAFVDIFIRSEESSSLDTGTFVYCPIGRVC